jgi:hypothetical protein
MNSKRNNKIRKSLLAKCGLPDIEQTSHCFNDETHHTCCLLGKNARNYADSTGNPIGKLSESIQNGSKTRSKSKTLVPWCTCTGSKVCSFYSQKFGKSDGTHIKFIGSLKPKKTKKKWNENNAINRLQLLKHKTSGVF